MKTIFVVTCTTTSDTWVSIHTTQASARNQALHEIAAWVEGEWGIYNDEDVLRFKALVLEGKIDAILEHWNDMSGLQISIDPAELNGTTSPINWRWPDDTK